MELTRTTVYPCASDTDLARVPSLHAAYSLHNHTSCSKESLDFVPGIARRIPLVASLFEHGLRKYAALHGRPLDFERIYWRPPLGPEALLRCEGGYLRGRLNVMPMVAITDHDTLEGPTGLLARGGACTPFSFEWTVPFEGAEFHLGVHNLPPPKAREVFEALQAYTRQPVPSSLAPLLAWLAELHDTFVVLNHPLWDFAEIGPLRHESTLLAFLRTFGTWIHALELNGYRRWSENRRVLPIAEGFALPVVCGGDRHGLTPSAMVNLSPATSWAEFAHDLRHGGRTVCVVLPEYFEPFPARVLQGARDALHHAAHEPDGPAPWVDRVFFVDAGVERPLASVWPRGGPWWLRGLVRLTRLLGSRSMRPIYRLALTTEHALP